MSLIKDNETTMTLSDRNHMCKFSSFFSDKHMFTFFNVSLSPNDLPLY